MDRVEARGPAKLILLFLAVWIACGLVGTAGLWAADRGNQNLYSTLEKRGVVTSAVVIGTDPRNHNTVSYSCDVHEAAVAGEWWRQFLAGMFLGSVIAVVITAWLAKRRHYSATHGDD